MLLQLTTYYQPRTDGSRNTYLYLKLAFFDYARIH